jgi:hypothetical protein
MELLLHIPAIIMPINELACAPNRNIDFENKPKNAIPMASMRLRRHFPASFSIPNWLNDLGVLSKPQGFRPIKTALKGRCRNPRQGRGNFDLREEDKSHHVVGVDVDGQL